MKTAIQLAIFFSALAICCLGRKEVNFIRFANCREYKNLTAFYQNVVFKKDKKGKTVSVKFDYVVKKEIKKMIMNATLQKCITENLDSCEYYMKDFKINRLCDIMGQKNQIWSDALLNSNFPRSCPIPAKTYTLNDTELDNDMQLALLPIPIALWKIKLRAYDSENNDILFGCTYLEVKVYSARRN